MSERPEEHIAAARDIGEENAGKLIGPVDEWLRGPDANKARLSREEYEEYKTDLNTALLLTRNAETRTDIMRMLEQLDIECGGPAA